MYKDKGNHIITTVTEHKAVLDACKHVEKLGGKVTYLPVKEDGLVDLAVLEAAMTPKLSWYRSCMATTRLVLYSLLKKYRPLPTNTAPCL
jgi:cysteine sulfinate desulfinase/cysteine desulfurase-like protein